MLPDHAGDVPLGDMADLVGQHRHQFGFRLGLHHQPGVHANVATRQGEGIDAAVLESKEPKGLWRKARTGQ